MKFCRFGLSVILLSLVVLSQVQAVESNQMSPEAIREAMSRATATLRGKIRWPGRSVPHATVQVYRDSALKSLYSEGVLRGSEGDFEIQVEPGSYYLVAFVDMNNSGDFDAGDGMGIYGITEWNDRTQERQVVRIRDHETIGDLTIQVSAIMAEIGGTQQILAIDDPILEQTADGFALNLRKLFTGVRGKVESPDQTLDRTLVYAYTDPSWKYEVGHAVVQPDGAFEISLPPGKYYLLTVSDKDESGKFDAGDPFGIYGVVEAGREQLPKPVLVERNRFTEDIVIPMIGTRPKEAPPIEGSISVVPLSGKVLWPGHALANTQVEVYQDATLTHPVAEIPVQSDGNFKAKLPGGRYYLVASVDTDGDGTYSPGDAIGGYGTVDIAVFPPGALLLSAENDQPVTIEISARYDSTGQLYSAHSVEGDLPVAPTEITGSGISGRVLWREQPARNAILLVSQTPSFDSPLVLMMQLREEGAYAWALGPGDYYLMAVVDSNGNRLADVEDGVGIYGTRNPVSGTPQRISVFENHVTSGIDIEIRAIYTDLDGTIAQIEDAHRSEIRLQHGEPEDLYQFTRFGKVIQEWWYWTQGIGFVFESLGLGWKLTDTKHFEPKPSSDTDETTADQTTTDHPITEGVIYYQSDEIIWGIAPDGTQQPLAFGSHLTTDADGTTLAFLDLDGNVRVATPQEPTGSVVLDRTASASSPVLSPDGRYIVYVHKMARGSQLYMLHLASGQVQPVPTAFRDCDSPTWGPDGTMIAYAASGSIDQPDSESSVRNLYLYDIATQRIEPLVIGPEDDAEPDFATDGSNVLVFSREEKGHRQLWKATIGEGGKASVEQLTRYGGSHPRWLPKGGGILYQNNGQVWWIGPDSQEGKQLVVNGQVVLGTLPVGTGMGPRNQPDNTSDSGSNGAAGMEIVK